MKDRLDGKYYGFVRRFKDQVFVLESDHVVFLAKDNAFAAILPIYREKCIQLGSPAEHIESIDRLITRVNEWRVQYPERCRTPD